MDRCRICLEYKKHLCSLFENEQGVSYANMIISVTKIKNIENEYGLCLQCRRKLRSLYDFKNQIERSEIQLNEHLKILNFNNIEDLKTKLNIVCDFTEKKSKAYNNDTINNYINLLQTKCDMILYNNTTIKKIQLNNKRGEKIDIKPALIQFHTIKKEFYSDCSNGKNVDITSEDIDTCADELLKSMKKHKKIQKNVMKQKGNKINEKVTQKHTKVCIKPIILKNIRILRTLYRKRYTLNRKNNQRKRVSVCPYCGILCTHLNSHILIHTGERKNKCSDCRKAFFTIKQLSTHQKTHKSVRNLKCDHCVAVFSNKSSLQSHMVMHTDDKKYICSVCNKGFKRKGSMRRHTRIHNSAAKNVKCELCNMSFLFKQGLRHHMRVHTGERPFKCEICSQPYSYKNDFNRHCLKKHGVFLKRRSVNVMTEEVLLQERKLMKDLMLRMQGVVKEGEPINPFQGPQAALAFEQAIKALGSNEITKIVL